MSEDISDIIKNVKNMVDNGNIPDNMKDILSTISSDNNSNNKDSSNNSNNFSIDMDTIIKIKKIIDKMNNNEDPRAKLLYSLKPYLRESKKNKLDQYINFLNITKIADIMNNEKKENDGNV